MMNIRILPDRAKAFGALRILFGLIWVLNTFLQANSAYVDQFLHSFHADWVSGQPVWLAYYGHGMAALVTQIGPAQVAWASVGLDGLLAVTLLTGIGLPFMAWVGVVYNLWLWSTVGGLGGPYTAGATDPGTAIIYALCFLLVIFSRSWEGLSLVHGTRRPVSPRAMTFGRILFGLLWLFDAYWKWQPYFLTHSVTYLQQAQAGQPAWIASYIGFFIALIQVTGPMLFGLFAAVVESVIGLALVFDRALRWVIPIGAAYSFGLWTTAEGWGGPFGPGYTGNKGDVLGTTIIYMLAFFFLAVWVFLTDHPAPQPAAKRSPPRPA